jgi:hypothetical protein
MDKKKKPKIQVRVNFFMIIQYIQQIIIFICNFSIITENVIPRVARDLLKNASVPAFGDPSLLSG